MNNALAQLMALAGQGETSEAFAGNCVACGRGMYKRNQGDVGRQHGWVMRANHYRCMTCYQQARSAEKAEYDRIMAKIPDPLTREELAQKAVALRAEGYSIRRISFHIGRSERVVCKMLEEAGGSAARKPDGVKICVDCGQFMRFPSEPEVVGVLKKGRGRCVRCYGKFKRQAAAPKPRRPAATCDLTHCSVCQRKFGDLGPYGGVVRVGRKSTGECTTCRDRILRAKKQGFDGLVPRKGGRLGRERCAVCASRMRSQGSAPVDGVVVRATTSVCAACYQRGLYNVKKKVS